MDTRLNRENDLLAAYRVAFDAKLTDLGLVDEFTLTDAKLQQAVEQKSIYGFTMMLTTLPLMMRTVPPTEGESPDHMENIRRMQNALFANEDYVTILKYSLRKFQKMGTFDKLSEGRCD